MSRHLLFFVVFSIIGALTAHGDSGAYVVKKGDTLYRISRECDIPVTILKSVNRMADSESLAVGRKLTIPVAYTVKKGDTLYGIDRRYGVSADVIATMNGLSRNQALKVNQKIYIVFDPAKIPSAEVAVAPEVKNQVFWPLPGKREFYDGKMRGILISGEKGDLVYSVSKGRVIWAGPYRGFGNVVLVNSSDDLVYGYLGIEELIVSASEEVESGSALGRIGVYFHQTDAKLLFIIYHNVKRLYLDPQEVLYTTSRLKEKSESR